MAHHLSANAATPAASPTGHHLWCHPAGCTARLHHGRLYGIRTLDGVVAVALTQRRGDPPRVQLAYACPDLTVLLHLTGGQAGELAETMDVLAREIGA